MDKVKQINYKASQLKTEQMLKLEGVSKDFGGIKAVDQVNLTVNKGELRCLIGPNGAGKSTIFKLIMGIYEVSSGRILFNGQDITRFPVWKRSRSGLSIKMQIPGVYGELTLRENIRIAAQNFVSKQELEDEIDRLIDLVGITHLGNPLVRNLSHGQQQWLEIAMSLASKPDLLLLDEPAAGMGPEETEFTAQIIRRLNKSGLTIIFIDHDMEFVREIAEKITVLHYGRLFAEGTLAEIESNEEVVSIYLGND
ncbi:ABC transporter ATP-binding protein [Bacillus sp. FJAT-50079]|uniref:ABC transporter ATP-binding protein n=1 Tax=Bacillus sp. FJAT-50079 TaxID=2833577 RepID=UPI001BC9BA6B|nr:ABC transporter ATP-binding protein [Bacillus sp. FJAT-50079]MBS4206522.1 ABC transporter ATP-binding protein [Bacillus sp. FJAT-50079]